jgi:hypothetical protein
LRARLSAALNANQVLDSLCRPPLRRDANFIPVPIPRWCRKTQEERRRFVASRDREAGRPGYWRAPRLPFLAEGSRSLEGFRTESRPLDQRTLEQQIDVTARQYTKLDSLFHGPPQRPALRPVYLSEASALAVQLSQIAVEFGADCASDFAKALASQAGPYALALGIVGRIASGEDPSSADVPLDPDAVSAIATWCLLAHDPRHPDEDSAVIRLAWLLRALASEGIPRRLPPIRRLYEKWDAATGMSPTFEWLEESLVADDKYAEQLERWGGELYPDGEFMEWLVVTVRKAFAAFRKARREAVEMFLSAPDDYVLPSIYLTSVEEYPRPPVMFVFTSSGLFNPDGMLEQSGYDVYLGYVNKEGRTIANMFVPPASPPGEPFVDNEVAFSTLTLLALADALFAPLGRNLRDVELMLAQNLAAERGMRMLTVLF